MRFGDRIKEIRESRGIPAFVLADRLRLSPSYWDQIESGRRMPPSNTTIKKIAKYFKTDVEELMKLANTARGVEFKEFQYSPFKRRILKLLNSAWPTLNDDQLRRIESIVKE